MINLFFQYSKIVVIVSTLMILLAHFIVSAQESSNDLLVYTVIKNHNTLLMLYDFGNATNTQILTSADFIWFSLSQDGQLAYSANESNGEIYLLDTRAVETEAINITQMPATRESPLLWSPDGRYLAFISRQDRKLLLYIWDGETALNVTPEDLPEIPNSYRTTWSYDGQLAITVSYGNSSNARPNEIYLWDGNTTSNLSQNPTGRDTYPVWSVDGRLAFLSKRDDKNDIYVWDGVSFKDGSPDFDTFTNIAPELTSFMSEPVWDNEGLLSFLALSQQSTSAQLYVWDGQTATNISQDWLSESGTPHWSSDGRLAFIRLFDPQLLLHVYDADKLPLLRVATRSSPAWSSGGYLMFCSPRKELSIWDGSVIVKVASGEIRASWGNGNSTVCSSG